MGFNCTPPCNREFTTKTSLLRHQYHCVIHATSQALKLEKRRFFSHRLTTLGSSDARKSCQPLTIEDDHRDNPATGITSMPGICANLEGSTATGSALLVVPSRPTDANSDHGNFNRAAPQTTVGPFPPSAIPEATSYSSLILPSRRFTQRVPGRFLDIPPMQSCGSAEPDFSPPNPVRRVILHVHPSFRTAANQFGVLREYTRCPSYEPDMILRPEDLANFRTPSSTRQRLAGPASLQTHIRPPPWPFENMSKFLLMNWQNSGSNQKTENELNRLVKEVIRHPEFKAEDVSDFNARRENKHLDEGPMDAVRLGDSPFLGDGWREINVNIEVPVPNAGQSPRIFPVQGLHHRSIIEVIKAVWSLPSSSTFHLHPFHRIHIDPCTGKEIRIFDEAYTSDAFEAAYSELQKQPPVSGCKLERVVAGLMFWSDSTHLTTFGTAKVWPLYMYFANLSKYTRARANSGACHHIAYIPYITDALQDVLAFVPSANQKKRLIPHCRRELMHQVWHVLLDEEFLDAYKHGVVLKCADDVFRRVYPQILTYSADHPEKMLLAALLTRGRSVCPRCLIETSGLDKLGTASDTCVRTSDARYFPSELITKARDMIYRGGIAITSEKVRALLNSGSWTPTINVFANKLGPYGIDPYAMLVVDLLHEFELGIWKSTFVHIIRVLYSARSGDELVSTLNARFRQVPTFGRDTIRRFSNNVSEMKNFAACNYEDVLQCVIPAIEGLLPEPYNEKLLKLLYRLAEWHALAKLRMHTEETLLRLDKAMKTIVKELRSFRKWTSSGFTGEELARDAAHQARQMLRKQGLLPTETQTNDDPFRPVKIKKLNLHMYKFHVLGDYVSAIRLYGTTDSYSTQIGENAHRLVKRFYRRTNHVNVTRQIAKQERRNTQLRRAQEAACGYQDHNHSHHVRIEDADRLPYTDVDRHHHMSESKNFPLDLYQFVHSPPNDPAKKDFIPKLKDHILGRLLGYDYDETNFSTEERNAIRILNNRIYASKVLRVNYTTYDMRRDQDSMNPRTHCDVMVNSCETKKRAHPFWYARVLGVFHLDVLHTGASARNRSVQRMEFLWVRWFGVEPDYLSGSRVARLPKIGFVPESDDLAFGFLDPSLVIRGCHLVPDFARGRTSELLQTTSPTAARRPDETDDWMNYYVMIWVDRDMFMRYSRGGLGHIGEMYRESFKTNSEEMMDIDSDVEGDELNGLGQNATHREEECDEDCLRGISRPNFSSDDGSDRSDFGSDLGKGSNDSSDDDSDLGPEDGEISDDDNNFACF